MPRLSQAHDRTRRQVRDLGARGLPPARLARQIAEALQGGIGFDGYRLFGLDRRTMLINRLLAASDNDGDARLEWLREVYLTLPIVYAELTAMARSGLGATAFQERQEHCWGFPSERLRIIEPDAHYRAYHECRSPHGGTLHAIFRANGVPVAALQAYRRDAKRQYRPTDVAFLQLISPAIGEAIAAALARERSMTIVSASADDASGMLLIGDHGDIRFATPAGEQWLATLSDGTTTLPTAFWATMADLRAAADRTSSAIIVPTPTVSVRVEASLSGQPGVTAFVVTPERAPAAPDVPASWPLTAQEREVVTLLATGKSNRQIAATMYIGEHTVEWHLRKVYDKLDVRSRQEVLAALFRGTLMPDIERTLLADARSA